MLIEHRTRQAVRTRPALAPGRPLPAQGRFGSALGAAAAARLRYTAPELATRSPAAWPVTVIAIGASTGGTEAIRVVLAQLPCDCPGIVIAQHMPSGFARSFAERLDRPGGIRVKVAEPGESIMPGHAYVAPGHAHLLVRRHGPECFIRLTGTAPVNRYRPSVDVLFQSAAQSAGRHALGVILTGLGTDGATGMLALRDAGAFNIAQDEASSVAFGMPREAIAAGAVHAVLPLQRIAGRILYRIACGSRAEQLLERVD
jgi:two-component system chemotaxis response regulator CheB